MGRNSFKGMIIALIVLALSSGVWFLVDYLSSKQPPKEPSPKSSQPFEKCIQDVFSKESEELKQHIAIMRDNIPSIYPFKDSTTRSHDPPFGWRIHPIWGSWDYHTGLDIEAKMGEPIYSVAAGIVTKAEYNGGYGLCVDIKHDNIVTTRYAMCDKLLVKIGQVVKKEETIALVGSTGISTGPHLHFEVIVNNEPVDPDEYIPNKKKMKGSIYAPKR